MVTDMVEMPFFDASQAASATRVYKLAARTSCHAGPIWLV